MQSPPSSVAFSIGGFDIHYYGLIMFCAIIFAISVICFVAKKYYKDTSTDRIIDMLPVIILSAILSARIYYVFMDIGYFSKNPSEIIALWHGGMSIHGAILGGVIAGIIYCKINKINFFKYADIFSYGVVIGQAVGRFGNWFNCEAFGKPCSIPFIKLFIPAPYRPDGFENIAYYHPAFLYESLWDIAVFLILFFIIRKITGIKDGTIFFSYLILYSSGRIVIEWCRMDSVLNIGGIAVAQIVSLILIFVAAAGLFLINKNKIEKVR